MFFEQLEVEISVGFEWIDHVRIEIDSQQTAGIVRTEGNLTARIGRYSAVAQVCITVGNGLADDGVPEQYAGLGRLPCVVDNLLPQSTCIYGFLYKRIGAVDGVLLYIRSTADGGFHECVIQFHRNISACHLAFSHFGVDESFRIGMFDGNAEH